MADDMSPDIGAPAADFATGPVEPPAGPFGLPVSRIVVIVAAVVGLLVVVGLVGGLVVFTLGRNAAQQAAVDGMNARVNAPATPVATRTVETSATEGNREVVPVTNKDVFTSRDPFEPVLKPLPQVTTTASVPATGSPDFNTLVLENIVTSNGVLTAILKWNGAHVHRRGRPAARISRRGRSSRSPRPPRRCSTATCRSRSPSARVSRQ